MPGTPPLTKRLRLGLLTQWYDPEPGGAAIPGALARELVTRGHDVTVITGFPNYPSGRIYPGYTMRARSDTRENGVRVRRVPLYASHDSSSARRALNYGSFAASAATLGLPALRGLDALWVYNSPASIAVPMWMSRYLLGVPHVLHVMDLWPDSIRETAFGSSAAGRSSVAKALDRWCSAMYRSASSVAYITPGVGRELANRGVAPSKLHYAPIWADELVARAAKPASRSDWGIADDEILMLYAGTMGEAQGLHSLIDGLSLVSRDTRVACLMAGTGTAASQLEERANTLGLTNVRFIGQVPREQMGGIMSAADLHVVTLRDTPLSRITMPSKIQTTLASGKAFIAAVTGDSVAVAEQSKAALIASPGNPTSIAAAIETASRLGRNGLIRMGDEGRRYYESTFSIQGGVDRIERLLVAAARERLNGRK